MGAGLLHRKSLEDNFIKFCKAHIECLLCAGLGARHILPQGAQGLPAEGTLGPQRWLVGEAAGGATLGYDPRTPFALHLSMELCFVGREVILADYSVKSTPWGCVLTGWGEGLRQGRLGKGCHIRLQSSGRWASTWPFQSKDKMASSLKAEASSEIHPHPTFFPWFLDHSSNVPSGLSD